ncbi:AbrB/MazE/SpoVT family DNA-binding domain-containing protein [Gracilibacillus timonensis]|uniref:AbrB/MazE/SpoVT family DNA-binding domain-containing protein n=1 Tax=Gracilibacillus timonensis TaxID=1816696 RepID=UPI000826B44D|nr:AbrB/MazE/SpoVT family DNA-binding domain-containing protein [Gracilibacillus timonensis]
MKSTEITKKSIKGRVVIPYQIRDMYGVSKGDTLQISLEESEIILSKPDYNLFATSMQTKIDELGRVNIPMELRKYLHISKDDYLTITLEGNYIVIRKAVKCVVTGNTKGEIYYVGNGNIPISKPGAAMLIDEVKNLLQNQEDWQVIGDETNRRHKTNG